MMDILSKKPNRTIKEGLEKLNNSKNITFYFINTTELIIYMCEHNVIFGCRHVAIKLLELICCVKEIFCRNLKID